MKHPMHSSEEEESHHCTDPFCLILFIVTLICFGGLYSYSSLNANLGKLYYGMDYNGDLCGEGLFANMTYLYWCPKQNAGILIGEVTSVNQLDLANPICVSKCPDTNDLVSACASIPKSVNQTITPVNDDPTGYNSGPFLGRYCLPDADQASTQAVADQILASYGGYTATIFSKGQSIVKAWPVLLITFFASLAMGFAFMLLIRCCGCCMIWGVILGTILGSAAAGTYLWFHTGDIAAQFQAASSSMPPSMQNNSVLAIQVCAGICWAISAITALIACIFIHSVEAAIECAELASEVIFDMPCLLILPLIKAVFKGAVALFLLYGALMLTSMADVTKPPPVSASSLISGEGEMDAVVPSGLSRHLHFTNEQLYALVAYMFCSFWILCFIDAVYQFTIAYAAVEFYHLGADETNCCTIFRGIEFALTIHAGSLAFGSFIVAVFQTLQKIVEIMEFLEKRGAQSNPVSQCILACIHCCISCCMEIVKMLNKAAYVDIAMHSTSFCEAARNVMSTFSGAMAASFAVLNGATFVFTFFGSIAIAIGSALVAYIACTQSSFGDPTNQQWHVDDPTAPMVVAGILGFGIALDFMHVFDMVSDSLLYAYCRDPSWGAHNAPEGLKALIHSSAHP